MIFGVYIYIYQGSLTNLSYQTCDNNFDGRGGAKKEVEDGDDDDDDKNDVREKIVFFF